MKVCDKKPKKRSREFTVRNATLKRRNRRLQVRIDLLNNHFRSTQQELLKAKKDYKDCSQRLQEAEAQLALKSVAAPPTNNLAILREKPMAGFQFNLTMIAMAVELGKRVGFRAAADTLKMIFEMLGIDVKVPSHDAIEQWTLRFGVALTKDTFSREDRVLWMVDHSSQIGKERLLLIIGVALDDLPPPDETLTFEKLKVLAIVPGQSWKKEDVEREYLKLARQIGAPEYLLSDGAVELREPAEKLEKDGRKTIVLGDLKHHAANLLEKEIGRGERFQSFLSQVGLTRNRVQQTELDQFAPPTLRSKSRFMNLGPLLSWATMVLFHLNHPHSQSRSNVNAERMEQKLGWLREYALDLERWNQCQAVSECSLSVINCQGLDCRTVELVERSLNEHNPNWQSEACSATSIALELIEWIKQSSHKLKPGERAWLSTEILESLFGKYKQVECQHSRGGFTRLIAAIPTLCIEATKEGLRKAFQAVNCKATQQWIKTSLGSTLTSRKNAAYRESRSKNQVPLSAPA